MANPDPEFSVRADLRAADHAVVTVSGEVDLETAPRLEQRLLEVVERAMPVIVDLASCSYMDSSGFRVIHRVAEAGRIALVIPPDAFLVRVVRIAALTEIVAVYDDVPSALHALREGPQ